MQRILRFLGWLFCIVGLVLIAVYVVMTYMGLAASLNFGNPTKFEFVLVPLWEVGLAVGIVGGTCLLASQWFGRALD